MTMPVQPIEGTEVEVLTDELRDIFKVWRADVSGPPVPVVVANEVWSMLLTEVQRTDISKSQPRVFRLLMRRSQPRQIVKASEISRVTRSERGIIRWIEGGYPRPPNPLRKGGNVFIRGNSNLLPVDTWWMAREETEIRILFLKTEDALCVSAWWCKYNKQQKLGRTGTDGEPWPVKLLIAQ